MTITIINKEDIFHKSQFANRNQLIHLILITEFIKTHATSPNKFPIKKRKN